jgi:hypothetical protein
MNTPWTDHCTQWLGFSQAAGFYKAATPGPHTCFTDPTRPHFIPDDRTELRWCQGCGVERYGMTPGPTPTPSAVRSAWDASITEQPPVGIFSRCDQLSGNPDRVVYVVTDGLLPPDLTTPDAYQPYMDQDMLLIRQQYSNVKHIILETVIGGPHHTTCYCQGANNCFATPIATPVRASVNHPIIDQAIALWINRHPEATDVSIGMSPEVDDCNWFADGTGHLRDAVECDMADRIAAYYMPVGPTPAE